MKNRNRLLGSKTTKTLFQVLICLGLLAQPSAALAQPHFTVSRGVALYLPFMDRSAANLKNYGRTFGPLEPLVRKRALADIKSAGFDTVRMPVAPQPLLEQDGDRFEHSLDEIEIGIDVILAAGLKVVVDLHVGGGDKPWQNAGLTRDTNAPEFLRYLDVVEKLGERLHRFDPALVAFEPFNEPPCDGTDHPGWPVFMKALFARARRAAPETTVVIAGACWGSWDGLTHLDPADYDDNTLFTFHYYDPHIFTHQGTLNTSDPSHYVSRVPYPLSASKYRKALNELTKNLNASKLPEMQRVELLSQGRRYLRRYREQPANFQRRVDAVTAWALQHGVADSRIFVGEFGVTKDMEHVVAATPRDRARWFRDARLAFEGAHFGWIA